MTERIRLTITVTPEVHEVFSRMAESSGLSLGRTMGDWLEDTIEGAQFVAQKMVEAKQQPRLVMREMQAMAAGLQEEVANTLDELRKRGADGRVGGAGAAGRAKPPSSPTGVNTPARKARKP